MCDCNSSALNLRKAELLCEITGKGEKINE